MAHAPGHGVIGPCVVSVVTKDRYHPLGRSSEIEFHSFALEIVLIKSLFCGFSLVVLSRPCDCPVFYPIVCRMEVSIPVLFLLESYGGRTHKMSSIFQ